MRLVMMMACVSALAGCSTLRFIGAIFGGETGELEERGEAANPVVPPSRLVVGTVRFSYEGFVLIHSPTRTGVAAGTRVMTLDEKGQDLGARMEMTGDRKHSFYVADVVEGSPRAGEVVVTAPEKEGEGRSNRQHLP